MRPQGYFFSPGRISGFDSRAQQRRSLLKNPILLNGAPMAVQDYFDGQEHCDLLAVAQWAIDQGQNKLLQQLQADGFQGPVTVSHLRQARTLCEVPWPELAVKVQFHHQIDAEDVGALISLLRTPGVKVTELWLNLSSKIAAVTLDDLLETVDALPNLAELRIMVDSRVEGPVEPSVRLALAKSKACMTLSPEARFLILDNRTLDYNVLRNAQAKIVEQQIECDERGVSLKYWERLNLQLEAEALRFLRYMRHVSECVEIGDTLDALNDAPAALQAFMGMDRCPKTGKPIKDQFANTLARTARFQCDEALLCAVLVLAPDYVMRIQQERMPSQSELDLLKKCQVPCDLKMILPSAPTIGSFRQSMEELNVVKLTLSVSYHLDAAETKNLVDDIAAMPPVKKVSFIFDSHVSVNLRHVRKLPARLPVDSLVLNGGEHAGSDESLFLQILCNGLQPSSLTLRQMTQGGAAALINSIDETGRRRLRSLAITCIRSTDQEEDPQEPSLVAAIGGLLEGPHELHDILVKSWAPLAVNADQIASLKSAAEINPPTGAIRIQVWIDRMDGFESGWHSYLHLTFPLHALTKTFFSLLVPKLPPEVARHTVNIGALSYRDIPTLRFTASFSSAMSKTWSELSIAQLANTIVFDLKEKKNQDVRSLRQSLRMDGGEPDQALVDEVRRQLLEEVPPNQAAVAILDAAVKPQ